MKIGMALLLAAATLRAESGPAQSDEQFMRMMQMRAEENRMNEEFKNPKKPAIDKSRVRGNAKAPVMIVEYSDFQCPYCTRGYNTMEEVRKKYGNKVALLFKHLPLPFHPMALPAAKRFEAIAMQSKEKAYQFHDQIFQNQARLKEGETFMDSVAEGLKIDMKKYKTDIDSPKVAERIEKDKEEAKSFGISGTPGFIVSGVTVKGAYPAQTFYQIIDKRLAEKKSR